MNSHYGDAFKDGREQGWRDKEAETERLLHAEIDRDEARHALHDARHEIERLRAEIEVWRGKLAEQCGHTLAARLPDQITMSEDTVEKVARALAYEHWPLALEDEKRRWADAHWRDYARKARAAIAALKGERLCRTS